MPRQAEPRYWAQRRQWYVMHKRKRHVLYRLKPGETEKGTKRVALEAFGARVAELKASGEWEIGTGDRISVATMGRMYLKDVSARLGTSSLPTYKMTVKDLTTALGKRAAADVTPEMVVRVYAGRGLVDNTLYIRYTVIKGWWKWAAKRKLIPANRMAGLERPRATPRDVVPTPEECRTLLDAPKPRWIQDVCEAVYGTGARPSEVFRLTASDVDLELSCWRMRGKTTRKTGRERVVHFSSDVAKLLRRLMAERPTGPLFRRPRGRVALSHATLAPHLIRIRREAGLGDHVTLHSMRHMFATDALEAGVSADTVAALLGHTDSEQVRRTYGRLRDRDAHLKEALNKVRGS